MIQTRSRAVVLSLFAVLALSSAVGVGCSGGASDDDDDAGTTQTPSCTPLPNNNLSTLQTAIFTPNCALQSCHDSVAPAGNLDLSSANTSHTEMVGVLSDGTFNSANIAIVDSGNSGGSFLYLKVTGANGISGAQMPDTNQDLCGDKVDAIAAWIDAGAQNN
jgi:hypothetical protein